MSDTLKPATGLSRRTFLTTSAVAGLGLSLGFPAVHGAKAQNAGKVIYATWGGSWEAAIKKAWFEPFTKATGIEVVTAQDNNYGKFQSMVESGSVEWDVVETNPDFQYIGAEKGLLEPLDFSVIDKSKIMKGEGFVTEYSVPQVLWSRLMAYNTKALGDKVPMDYTAIFNDVAGFPGKRAFQSEPNSGAFEAALLAAGVAPDKLYPLDIDKALEKWTEIKDHISFYETNAQAQQYISDGQASLSIMPDGRAMAAIKDGSPVGIQYNQSIMTWSSMVVPKGAPNKANAMKFLAYTMTPEAQAAIANEYTYGPVVPDAFKFISPERAKILSGGPQQQGKFIMANEEWWAKNLEEATERLTEWRLS
ncbi:putative spermidine/putrescine transport system substrate-binding protein [Rhodoligotrophos appendicifer]|uniref:extracellular solute-binding protein n=1 Tax=Rhodoligotrophos appendicifer TaxID=987056 RepID=UPI0014784F5E|nr:extracellular solute-binding protein [Rhodoligotrophos appendicifer]